MGKTFSNTKTDPIDDIHYYDNEIGQSESNLMSSSKGFGNKIKKTK